MVPTPIDATERLAALARRDLHVHTPYCNHAAGPMEDYVLAAMDRGLEEIGFLAHVECEVRRSQHTWLNPQQLDQYWDEGHELRERYQDRIRVSLGVEVGLNPRALDGLDRLIHRHSWDRVGLSFHYVTDAERDQVNICSRRDVARGEVAERDLLALNRHYYEVLRQGVERFRPFMVCHLDVLRRNLPDCSEHPTVQPRIELLLQTMGATGCALEVNTAGYVHRPHGLSHPYPAPWILARAMELGLPLAFCSDSHAPREVARHFEQTLADCRRWLPAAD